MVRVRFAPSPTGELHVGLARTALFNWLFAKKHKGIFILRIEDTDEIRSTKESVFGILESLVWLGINWDEGPVFSENFEREYIGDYGPYFQMQKLEVYKKYAIELIKMGYAYYCYCTDEELEEMRKEQLLKGIPPRYSGRCRKLSEEDISRFQSEGRRGAIRFKVPDEGEVVFNDVIHGEIKFKNAEIGDFIILKSSGVPTYNFACVIDDHLMKISHVIRGDDHISNTPKQIHLYEAFGWEKPIFAHLPMILGPDRAKLSKRHGAMSIKSYRDEGFLPQTMVNYLALLGWSTSDSQQIFDSIDELIEKFSLERCGKSPAIFDFKKLLWMNSVYMKKISVDEIYERGKRFIGQTGLSPEYIKSAISLEKEKMTLLSDIPRLIDIFLAMPSYNSDPVDKYIRNEKSKKILNDAVSIFEKAEEFSAGNLEKIFREYSLENGYKTAEVFHPIRVAVSGRMEGPSLFKMLELLGKNEVIKRIKFAINSF